MTLKHGHLLRVEDDPDIIANLLRKGWKQNEPPSYDAATQHAPVWNGSQWTIADLSSEEIAARLAAQFPPATMLQVRVWMARNGINPTTDVPAIIIATYPEGPQRIEALERWEKAVTVPFDHPLVGVIASSLNLNTAEVWAEVLAIS